MCAEQFAKPNLLLLRFRRFVEALLLPLTRHAVFAAPRPGGAWLKWSHKFLLLASDELQARHASAAVRWLSESTDLKARFAELLPAQQARLALAPCPFSYRRAFPPRQARLKALKVAHGAKPLGTTNVDQLLGGMRGARAASEAMISSNRRARQASPAFCGTPPCWTRRRAFASEASR